MKFSKVTAVLAATVMMFSFAACGNKSDNDGAADADNTSVSEPAPMRDIPSTELV